MRNCIKRKLSWKIFFLTAVILLGISALTYGFVAYFMPVIYTETLNQNLDKRAENLSEVLHNYKKDQGMELIQEFSINSQSGVIILDNNGKIIYEQSYPFYEGTYAVEMASEDTMALHRNLLLQRIVYLQAWMSWKNRRWESITFLLPEIQKPMHFLFLVPGSR